MKFIFTWIPRIILILIVVFLLISVPVFFMLSDEPPSIEDAPWKIQTYSSDEFKLPSRFYYAESIEYIDGVLVLTGQWWNYDGEKYHKHTVEKSFPECEYGNIDIWRR